MNNHFPKSLKRAAAMLMTLLMLVSQVVAPVAALAAVDVSTLPVISVNYTDWDGNPQSVTVYPSLSGEQAVYWAQMPDNINWDAGVTLLAQTMDGSYCPLDGTVPYYAVNAPGLDGMSFTSNVDLFASAEEAGGSPFASVPLYLSSAPMPQPEPEPEPEPVYGSIVINYVDENGSILLSHTVDMLPPGDYWYTPDRAGEIADYQLVSGDGQGATVYADGTTSNQINFQMRKIPKTGSIVINYVDENGGILLSETKSDLPAGEYWYTPDRAGEIADYQLVSGDAQSAIIYDDGTTSNQINFQMQKIPKTGSIVINYVDENGGILLSETKTDLPAGEYWYTPDRAGEIADYQLVSGDAQSAIIYDDGTTSNQINFQMQKIPKTGSIVINYVDENGGILLSETKTDLPAGEYWYTPDRAGEIADYQLVSGDAQSAIIYDDGTTSNQINFQMQKIPKTGSIVINYVDESGGILLSETKSDLPAGEYWYTPDRAGEIADYQLVSGDAQSAIIYDDGTTSNQINFQMQKIVVPEPDPVFGSVTISYVNVANSEVLLSETKGDLAPGEYWFTPDRAGEVAGYELVSSDAQSAIIYDDGTTSNQINFQMQEIVVPEPEPEPAPVFGSVTISYVNVANSEVLLSETKGDLAPGEYWFTPDRAGEVAGYELVSSDAQSVVISDDGTASNQINFQMQEIVVPEPEPEPAPVFGSVTINYVNVANSEVLLSETKGDLAPGEYWFTPDRAGEVAGYELVNSDAQSVVISDDGTASNQINFQMQAIVVPEPEPEPEPEPDTAHPEISQVIEREGTTTTGGLNVRKDPWKADNVAINISKSGTTVYVYGLVVNGDGEQWYKINHNGTDGYVMANYVELTSRTGTVTVVYLADGAELASETVTVTETNNVISPDFSKVPADYTPVAVDPVVITFAEDGSVSPARVEFTFAAPVIPEKTGTVTVAYLADGTELASETVSVSESNNVISPDFSKVPADYTPVAVEPVVITFAEDGSVSPARVEFTFAAPVIPEKTGTVTVVYLADGTELASETVSVSESNNVVSPDFSKVPADYTPVAVEPVVITFAEDGSVSPARVEFTFDAPEKTGTVTVSYVNQRGEFASEQVAVSESSNVVAPNAALVPADYVATAADPVTVSFDENGNLDQPVVTFTYQAPAITGTVQVNYLNAATSVSFNSEFVPVTEGENTIQPNADMIPDGYTPVEVNPVQVTLNADGSLTPETVSFTYQAPPVTGIVDVLYVTAEAGAFASETVSINEGENNVAPNAAKVPEGYTGVKVDPVTVVLKADGTVEPTTVVFTYQAPAAPAQKASVTLKFVDEKGKDLLTAQTIELEDGGYDPSEFAAKPEGYTYQGASADWIQVAGGVATPDTITFTYAKNRTAADLTIRYVDAIGKELSGPEVIQLKPGTHAVRANERYIPTGYSLGTGNPASFEVVVDSNFVATPAEITFTLVSNSVVGTVNVRYIDVQDMSVISSQKLTLRPGTHTVTRNDTLVGNTYEPSAASTESHTVVVNDLGYADPNVVDFYYQKKQNETYLGYALVNTQTALRKAYNNSDSSIVALLPENTLVYVNGQATVEGTLWSSAQMVLGNSLDSGVVLASTLTPITREQAMAIINQYNQQVTPPTAQVAGYYMTRSDNVPLRTYADAQSAAKEWLAKDTIVYVSGLEYRNGTGWYASYKNGVSGYIRQDQLRKATDAEVDQYIGNQNGTVETPSTQPNPYDPYGKSSYGYVSSSTVNFRKDASASSARLKVLNRYAFCLVLGTRDVNGVTWYNVNQNGTVGWINGDYFHHLNLTELTAFLQSAEYKQGIANNSGNTSSGSSSSSSSGTSNSTGVAKPGNIGSVEDWNVGSWQNPGVSAQTSYAPFNPIATATPVPSVSPEASPEVTPTPTFVIGTMIPIDYTDESKETQTSTAPWGLIAAGVVLIGGAGGVYAYAMNQNRKRKAAAARAAQARRTANTANGQQNPYARRAVAAPPVSGNQQPNGQQNPYTVRQPQNPYQPQGGTYGSSESRNPYSNGTITGSAGPIGSTGTIGSTSPTGSTSPIGSTNPTAPTGTGYAGGFAPMSSVQPAPATTQTANEQAAVEPSDGASQFAPPASSGTAAAPMGSNPFARPINATPEQNPYARPVEDAQTGETVQRRRASRMERYRDVDNGTDAEA